MRATRLVLLSSICFAVVLPAAATPSGPTSAIVAPVSKVVLVADHCGQGRHWVPAGYAKHGKWRAGHCAPY
jgi:hypothetical protein